jgi:hypothetical protein
LKERIVKLEQVQHFSELGYNATKRLAARIDAGNASEFAALSVADDLQVGIRCQSLPEAIFKTQMRCRIDLSIMLTLGDDEQQEAVTAFVAGCYRFLEENPDE